MSWIIDMVDRITGNAGKLAVMEYERIMVPVFGTPLDDEIIGTAGRLADAALDPGERSPSIDIIYVVEVPLSHALEAPPDEEMIAPANAALERAMLVADEYETVEWSTAVIRARKIGEGIVEAASERDVEVIVMGAEPPSQIRGGAIWGGIGASRPPEIGPVTEYVLRRAPVRVLLTAPVAAGA